MVHASLRAIIGEGLSHPQGQGVIPVSNNCLRLPLGFRQQQKLLPRFRQLAQCSGREPGPTPA
jgi:hypothetical protein